MKDLLHSRVEFRCLTVGVLLLLIQMTASAEYTISDDDLPSTGMSTPLQLIVLTRAEGKPERALAELETLIDQDPAEPTRRHAHYLRARYRLEAAATHTNADAEWSELDDTISALSDQYPDDAGVALLRFEIDLARPDSMTDEQVKARLLELENQFFGSPEFWRGAFVLYTRLGRPERAEDALARFDAAMGVSLPARTETINRPETIAGSGRADRELAQQKRTLDDRYDDIQGYLSRVKGDLASRDIDAAILSLKDWILKYPASIQPRMMLMGVLLSERRLDDLEKLERELSSLDGSLNAFVLQTRVQRLLLMAEGGDEEAAQEASQTLRKWLASQPWQAAAHASAGALYEIRGEFKDAIESYRSAISYGNRDPNLLHSLLGLLLLTDQHRAMLDVVSELGRHESLTGEVLPLVVHAHLALDDADAAVSLAQKGIDANPNDSNMHAAMASAVLRSNRDDRLILARESLDRARELAPFSPARWAASLWISLQQNEINTEEIARLAHRAGALLNAYDGEPRDQWKSIAAAHCLELMGEVGAAKTHYQSAIDEVDGVTIHRWIPGGAVLPRDSSALLNEPRSDLRPLNELDPPIQQSLALIECFAETSGLPHDGPLQGDPRLEAVALLSSDGAALRRQAAERLATVPDELATASDHLFAARISRFHAPRKDVRSHFLAALALSPSTSELLEIVDDALDAEDLEMAAEAIELLKDKDKDKDKQAALLSELRWMLMTGQPEDAKFLASDFIAGVSPDERVELTRRIANLFAENEQLEIGLELLDAIFAGSPAYSLVRTEVLGNDPGGRQEAMELCGALSDQGQAYIAAMLAIRTAQNALPDQEFASQTDALIDQLDPDVKRSASFLAYLFRYRELQGRIQDAQRVAETAVSIDSSSFAQRNNRAWILAAYRDRAAEALDDVNRAIRDAGPREDLLDTKAVALTREGRPKMAASLLEPLVATLADAPASVPHALHLFESLRESESDVDSAVFSEWVEQRLGKASLAPFDRAAAEALLAEELSVSDASR